MTDRSYTPHQQGIIKRHYETADARAVQKLQELVSEIYLCESPKKADRLWTNAEKSLSQLNARPETIRGIIDGRDLDALAKLAGEAAGRK